MTGLDTGDDISQYKYSRTTTPRTKDKSAATARKVVKRKKRAVSLRGQPSKGPRFDIKLDFSTDNGDSFDSPLAVLDAPFQIRMTFTQHQALPLLQGVLFKWYLSSTMEWTDGFGSQTYEVCISNPLVVTRWARIRPGYSVGMASFKVLASEVFSTEAEGIFQQTAFVTGSMMLSRLHGLGVMQPMAIDNFNRTNVSTWGGAWTDYWGGLSVNGSAGVMSTSGDELGASLPFNPADAFDISMKIRGSWTDHNYTPEVQFGFLAVGDEDPGWAVVYMDVYPRLVGGVYVWHLDLWGDGRASTSGFSFTPETDYVCRLQLALGTLTASIAQDGAAFATVAVVWPTDTVKDRLMLHLYPDDTSSTTFEVDEITRMVDVPPPPPLVSLPAIRGTAVIFGTSSPGG